jgi:hypothetical protein
MTTAPIAVELEVEPTQLTLGDRDRLVVRVTVRNLGAQQLDPELNLSELQVNGSPAKAWNMALANSGRPKTWRALPPGESVSGAVAGIGGELFSAPGDYTLTLTVSGVAAPPVTVRVGR